MGALSALLTGAGALRPWRLLALTFAIGAGTAVDFPAWAAAIGRMMVVHLTRENERIRPKLDHSGLPVKAKPTLHPGPSGYEISLSVIRSRKLCA
jgi:Transmembrane secretion effector